VLGGSQNRYAAGPSPSGLADVLELILDKGLVADVYARVSLVGIELLTVDGRIAIASVDTYLRFAEAAGRLDVDADKPGLPQLIKEMPADLAKSTTRGALDAATEALGDIFGTGDDDAT
jgi:hypothetical protein